MGAGQESQRIEILDVGRPCRIAGERPRRLVGVTPGGLSVPLHPAHERTTDLDLRPATVLATDQAASFTLGWGDPAMCSPIPATRAYDTVEFTFAGRPMEVDLDPEPGSHGPIVLPASGECRDRLGVSELGVPVSR